jgi:hypothetical protein
MGSWVGIMDQISIKTQNPKCRLFNKIDLLKDFAALCLTDFIDWRYIHCCPSTFALTPPLPSQIKCTVYTVCGCGGVGGVLNCVIDDILSPYF